MSVKEQNHYSYMESEAQKLKLSDQNRDEEESKPPVSTQLYIKSSKPLDKDVIRERIQRRKCMNKVKKTFHSLVGLNGATSAQEQMWVDDLGDAFSCP